MKKPVPDLNSSRSNRCPWPGIEDPIYAKYHDEEWGVPHADDRRLFEKLILEGFQAGLSWLTILKKRDNFRSAFDGFDPERIARYGEKELSRLMSNKGIIRNRLKIEASVTNARAFLKLREAGSFASFIWRVADGKPVLNRHSEFKNIPAETELSAKLAKELKKAGFKFVGPTTVYAYMQSIGMVNDHLTSCPRHNPCQKLQAAFIPPAS